MPAATLIRGPLWAGRNWSADAGTGSIHDDATAQKLGFRGGTVAGDVHMNQFPPVLERIFGDAWWRTGNLALGFKFATVDMERVQVCAEPPDASGVVRVWMDREDATLVATGSASLGQDAWRAEQARDLRACSPAQLRILRRVEPGMTLGEYTTTLDPAKQFDRYDRGLISDALPIYRDDLRWGEPVAAPCTFVQYLWGPPTQELRKHVGEVVGLFGAIAISHVNGPWLLNREYGIESHVVSVGESPQTEYLWFDSHARTPDGAPAVSFRMMLRFMKAASPEYRD